MRQLPRHTLCHFPSFSGRMKSRGRVTRVSTVRGGDAQSMSPRRHRPRMKYHRSRLRSELRDSLTVDVSSVTRDVISPVKGWGEEGGMNGISERREGQVSQGARGRVLRRLRRQGQWLGRPGTSTQGQSVPEEKTG